MSAKQKHILVIRFSAMGDVAMTVPILRALKDQHPNLKITVLTKAAFAPMFHLVPGIQVFTADLKGEHKGIIGLYKLSKSISKLKVSAVADLHNVLRTHILRMFIRTRPFIKIDKGRKEKKDLVSGRRFEQLKTTHERYADVFRKLDLEVNLETPSFPSKRELNPAILSLIGTANNLIGIAPFAAFKGKAYPIEKMKMVIDELSKKHKILLFGGGKEESRVLDAISEANDNVINIAGKFSLQDELAIISNLKLMVSMDSGNAHLAAMLGIDVITLWGVTHPFAGFYPFNQNSEFAILANRTDFPKIPTSIYGNKYTEGYEEAIGSIGPDKIIEKVENVLSLNYTSS